jgi:hypothetical protein
MLTVVRLTYYVALITTTLCACVELAQAAPAGSYAQSCGNPTVTGNTLQATCKNNGGGQGLTVLPDFPSCRGDISNDDGVLVCDRGSAPPNGSYQRSCSHADILGGALEAVCRNNGRGQGRTTLADVANCRSDISNNNGVLFCNRGAAPPPGSYAQTCRAVHVDGNTLSGECRTRNGGFINSSLPAYTTCRGDISNFNGLLTCTMGDAAAPAGSYRDTCGQINFTGGTLHATCLTFNGGTRSNVLDVATCRGSLANIDGFLSCEPNGGLPQGSYQKTCINPVVAGSRLSARCVRKDQSLGGVTSLDISSCGGDISNTDGNLGCNVRRNIRVIASGGGTSAKFNVKGTGFNASAMISIFVADAGSNRRVFSQSADSAGSVDANIPLACVSGLSLTWSASDGTIESGAQVFSNAFTLPCP